jgi:hypothetical protein
MQHAAPSVGRLASVADLFFPQARHPARELSALVRVAPAKDLIFVELDHAAVVAEPVEQARKVVHHLLVGRR